MTDTTITAFLVTASLLAITPGPGILFVLAQTLRGGKSSGLYAVLGTCLGGLVHVCFGAIGLSAILYSSTITWTAIKTFGAIYLFFLAYKTLKTKYIFHENDIYKIQVARKSMQQGFITEALNPKTALFFLAFLPQFIDAQVPVSSQFLVLGATSVFLNTSADLFVVVSTSIALHYMRKYFMARGPLKYLSAASYAILGVIAIKSTKP